MMAATDFQAGHFKPYRATTKVHLGQIETDIFEGDVVEFDGQTLKYGGQDFAVPTVRGAIKIGWLVPADDNVSQYIPQPAGVRVKPAQSTGNERGEAVEMGHASEEEAVAGSLEGYTDKRTMAATAAVKQTGTRPKKAAERAAAVQADEEADRGSFRTMPVVADDGVDQEAVAVATIRTPAKQTTTLTDASQAASAVRRLDNAPPPKAAKLATKSKAEATGDVQETLVGDDLEDILPDAASSGVPKPKVPADFDWDTTQHWRKRVSLAVTKYADQPAVINHIMELETASVRKHLRTALARRSATS